jgi:hypothetical protein
MKTALTTLAYGKKCIYDSQENLLKDAKKYNLDTNFYNEHTLDKKFIEKNKEVFSYKRGWGFWLWKPFIIKETLKQLNEGDVCIYCDAGNSIVQDPQCLSELCIKNDGILLFENRDGNPLGTVWRNAEWTKFDCYTLMNCTKNKYVNGPQVDGAYSVWQKNSKVLEFLEEYLSYCENINIISDLPNITGPNPPFFKDHRHDQSILSLLAIKYNIPLYSEPSEWGNNFRKTTDPYQQIFWHHRCTIFGRRPGE